MLDNDGMMPKGRRNTLIIALLLAAVATLLTSLLLIPGVVSVDRQAFQYLISLQDQSLVSIF